MISKMHLIYDMGLIQGTLCTAECLVQCSTCCLPFSECCLGCLPEWPCMEAYPQPLPPALVCLPLCSLALHPCIKRAAGLPVIPSSPVMRP